MLSLAPPPQTHVRVVVQCNLHHVALLECSSPQIQLHTLFRPHLSTFATRLLVFLSHSLSILTDASLDSEMPKYTA